MSSYDLTTNEAWVFHALQHAGEADIHEMMEDYAEKKEWKYQTFQTYLERLRDKGLVKRKKYRGRFKYSIAKDESVVFTDIMSKWFGDTLQKDPSPIIDFLIEVKKMNAKEEKQLRSLIKI